MHTNTWQGVGGKQLAHIQVQHARLILLCVNKFGLAIVATVTALHNLCEV
jgi:hypothetical protein